MLSIHFHSASQLSIKTKVIISNLLWINITSWYHPNSLKPLTAGFDQLSSQVKRSFQLVNDILCFTCRLYKVRGSTKRDVPVFIKASTSFILRFAPVIPANMLYACIHICVSIDDPSKRSPWSSKICIWSSSNASDHTSAST